MTARARIRQDDMLRAVKAARAAAPDARVIFDLQTGRIEIIIGQPPANDLAGEWSDDDV